MGTANRQPGYINKVLESFYVSEPLSAASWARVALEYLSARRWAVFSDIAYYPSGGMSDCNGFFESESAARAWAEDQCSSEGYDVIDLWTIPDPRANQKS